MVVYILIVWRPSFYSFYYLINDIVKCRYSAVKLFCRQIPLFYLVIDNDQSQDNVYFLTEVDEKDLMNFTLADTTTLPDVDTVYATVDGSDEQTETPTPEPETETNEPETEEEVQKIKLDLALI